MLFTEFKKLVAQIKYGKSLPVAKYLHIQCSEFIPPRLLHFIDNMISDLALQNTGYNILKFHLDSFKVSLLSYPSFFDESYPPLNKSYVIDLSKSSFSVKNFEHSSNPPILHRKETFLHPNHPFVPKFNEITVEGEEAGLYENTRKIGFKKSWLKLIEEKGFDLVNGRIIRSLNKVENDPRLIKKDQTTINRYKTAIDRYSLSSPLQLLNKYGFINQEYSLLDYGCGKGDDIKKLQELHINCIGWDPVFFSENEKSRCDIVNLGFVINVIEDPEERVQCLLDALELTGKLLVVSVMLKRSRNYRDGTSYNDGIITKRNTFQKYFTQSELRTYIKETLDIEPVTVGAGVFFVFRNIEDEQNFLINKERRRIVHQSDRSRSPYTSKHNESIEKGFWNLCLTLGRKPISEEISNLKSIQSIFGSVKRAYKYVLSSFDEELLLKVRRARIEDILVFLAMSLFEKRKTLDKMPKSLRKDFEEFFGGFKNAILESKTLLFSVGRTESILKACEYTYKELAIGYLDTDHSLYVHESLLHQLPPVLRVYLGCAVYLIGDIDDADLVKIHIQSAKISLLKYDDFLNKPIPELYERIKISLKEQKIKSFKYGGEYDPQPLYLKSRYLPRDFPTYETQKKFDLELENLQLFDFSGYGPKKAIFYGQLSDNSIEIKGFKICRL
jgi:DNA phosphorothioation-associated putative methyltransferase